MEKLLLFVKHRLTFVWLAIEKANGLFFKVLYKRKLNKSASLVLAEFQHPDFQIRIIQKEDITELHDFLNNVDKSNLEYFDPHPFHEAYLHKLRRNSAFLMLGVFQEGHLVGYFFLRFFVNRSCFVGRIIGSQHQGMGIGKLMNSILYNISWNMGFRCLATISKHNHLVQRAHKSNSHMVVRKQLKNEYILVEFLPDSDELSKKGSNEAHV